MVLSILAIGCAIQPKFVSITYDSKPRGAYFKALKSEYGQLPFTINHYPTEEFIKGGCMPIEVVEVKWKSGAEIASSGFEACHSDGWDFTHIAERPNYPKLNLDITAQVEFDIRKLTEAQEKRRLDIEDARRKAQAWKDFSDMVSPTKPKATCTSKALPAGGYSTTCY